MNHNRLCDVVTVKPRFARSANIERDVGQRLLQGYIPTARGLHVITSLLDALENPRFGRAISVTGPYGSGKSSLGLFLVALLGPGGRDRDYADQLLASCDRGLARRLRKARDRFGRNGFIVCRAVARSEPITVTLIRAIRNGVTAFVAAARRPTHNNSLQAVLQSRAAISPEKFHDLLTELSAIAPLLILIDEFGKSLEHYSTSRSAKDDLYILQEIAEYPATNNVNPVLLMTMQHLAFDDYVAEADTVKRREWSKIQGRFIDIPYVESTEQAQALISSVYETDIDLTSWLKTMKGSLERSDLRSVIRGDLSSLYPLHPITAAVLPALCATYGQSERTLFSFLAGSESCAVPAFLQQHHVNGRTPPSVRLDRVYDFFVDSASAMIAVSASASRWLEIETRVRDATGLTPTELMVLKSVGILNLAGSGTTLRASKAVLLEIAADDAQDSPDTTSVEIALRDLEVRGLVTYRDAIDEYRVWSGSAFDIRSAVDSARGALIAETVASILQKYRPMPPLIASRHSQTKGILRAFARRYVSTLHELDLRGEESYDGTVLISIDGEPSATVHSVASNRPVILGIAKGGTALGRVARELAAHIEVLDGSADRNLDWVARRELRERVAALSATVDEVLERELGIGSRDVTWWAHHSPSRPHTTPRSSSITVLLSDLCDRAYHEAPIIRNEMISRKVLTSQGARARGQLLEAMVQSPTKPHCGIEGFGPERAIYEALLAHPGIHQKRGTGFSFGPPGDEAEHRSMNFLPLWQTIDRFLTESEGAQRRLGDLYRVLMAPPFGMPEGPVPILVVAALLARAQSVGLYENGSFVPRLELPTIERLVRNPDLFSVRCCSATGGRSALVARMGELLAPRVGSHSQNGLVSVVRVVGALLERLRALPPYTMQTIAGLSAAAVAARAALRQATEPDQLLFDDLPVAAGLPPLLKNVTRRDPLITTVAGRIQEILAELDGCYGHLLRRIETVVLDALALSPENAQTTIAHRIAPLGTVSIHSEVKVLLSALCDQTLERVEWLEYLAMATLGRPPRAWKDDDLGRFAARFAELAATIRRLEALYADVTHVSVDGCEPIRLVLTAPDGWDRGRILWVDHRRRAEARAVATQAMATAEAKFGAQGRELLLAVLAAEILGDTAPQKDESLPVNFWGSVGRE